MVSQFLKGKLTFDLIPVKIKAVLNKHESKPAAELGDNYVARAQTVARRNERKGALADVAAAQKRKTEGQT